MHIVIFEVVISCFILFLLYVGFGAFFRQLLFKEKTGTARKIIYNFWLGWAFSIALLQVFHVWFPINMLMFVLFSVLGIIGIVCFVRIKIFPHYILMSLLFIAIIWIVNRGIGPIRVYDAYLYHFGAIKWLTDYPLQIGLGKLHYRFAFNNSFFLYSAFLEVSFWKNISHNITNVLLGIVMLLQIFLSWHNLFKNKGNQYWNLFNALFLFPFCLLIQNDTFSSPTPDMSLYFISFFIASTTCCYFIEKSINVRKEAIFLVIILSCIGVTIKHSFIVYGFLFSLILFLNYRRDILKIILVTCIILGPWCVRNIYLSGYPVYLLNLFSFDVPWKIDPKELINVRELIKCYSRHQGSEYGVMCKNWLWFNAWFQKTISNNWNIKFPILIIAASYIYLIYKVILKKRWSLNYKNFVIFQVPPFVSIIFWFYAAPDIRFLNYYHWIIAIYLIVFCFHKILITTIHKKIITITMCILISIFFYRNIARVGIYSIWYSNIKEFLPKKEFELKKVINEHNVSVWVPVGGQLCGDIVLPCTPESELRGSLQYLDGETLESGFK